MNDKITNDSALEETDEPSTEADIEALIAKYSKPSRSSEKVEITNDKPTIGEWIQLIFGWIFVVIPMVAFGLYGAYYLVLGLPDTPQEGLTGDEMTELDRLQLNFLSSAKSGQTTI